MNLQEKVNAAFGFKVEIISAKDFEIHGRERATICVKRPKGKKTYVAIHEKSTGAVVAV